MAMFVRLADFCGEERLPSVQKAFFRNLVAVLIAGWAFFRHPSSVGRKSPFPMEGRTWRDLLLRCVFGSIGIFANFYALTHIPVADAMALNKTAPFFTLLMSWIILGQRMTLCQLLCVLGAFAGAMFVIKPGVGVFSGPALIGLASGLSAGAAYAYLHKLGKAGVDGAFLIFFFFCLFLCGLRTFSCLWFRADVIAADRGASCGRGKCSARTVRDNLGIQVCGTASGGGVRLCRHNICVDPWISCFWTDSRYVQRNRLCGNHCNGAGSSFPVA